MAYFNDKNSVLYGETANTSSGDKKPEISDSDYLIHNEEEALALCDKLAKIDNVLSVEYVSSEAGLESIKEGLLEGKEEYFTFLDDEHGNPLSAAAKITLKDMSKFKQTLRAIEKTQGVDTVQSQSDLADKINAIKEGIGIAGVWIIAILLIISLVIVSNTIRVTMYSRKLEISIMKAVGATNSFIRLPFVIEGVFIGLISAVVSTGILYFCYRVAIESIRNALGMMQTISFVSVLPMIVAVFATIGILSGIVGSVIMISKYLRKEGSEFTAI
jgi:cell division transport system permease protein